MSIFLYVSLGVVAGILSGMFGIGGGIVLIPALVYMFGLTQLQAQGTSLAVLVLPIGLLAAIRYYQSGNVRMDMVGFICAGFFIGAFLGANFVQNIPDVFLKRAFGLLMLLVSLKMIFTK